jgi:DNA-binding CsgD family transcriptional regulator
MRETETVSGLISDIYDAVLDDELWPDVLKKTAGFVGGPSVGLWSIDPDRTSRVAHAWGFDSGYPQAYVDEYGKIDPASNSFLFAGVGQPVTHAGLLDHDDYYETRFFREWSQPQGLIDCVNVPLEKSSSCVALLGVSRHKHDGLADEDTCRRMRLVAPHMRRAVLITRAIEFSQAKSANVAEAVDGLRNGVFLIDAAGCVVHANVAGQAILDQGDILQVNGSRLASNDPRIDEAIGNILALADQGDGSFGTKGIAMPLIAKSGERYAGHLLPLASGMRSQAGTAHAAVAALFVQKASQAMHSLPELIARSYQLTPMELRVLLAIVEVGGAPEVAELLGIATSTVKTHLGRVYEKTGTRRHADLVKLVAGFSGPLLD